MKIKHEDVFKYFWRVGQKGGLPDFNDIAYVKYNAYVPRVKRYYLAPGPDNNSNGVTLDFFQDKEYFLIPPE